MNEKIGFDEEILHPNDREQYVHYSSCDPNLIVFDRFHREQWTILLVRLGRDMDWKAFVYANLLIIYSRVMKYSMIVENFVVLKIKYQKNEID